MLKFTKSQKNYNKNYITDNLKYSKMAECLSLAYVAKPYAE